MTETQTFLDLDTWNREELFYFFKPITDSHLLSRGRGHGGRTWSLRVVSGHSGGAGQVTLLNSARVGPPGSLSRLAERTATHDGLRRACVQPFSQPGYGADSFSATTPSRSRPCSSTGT